MKIFLLTEKSDLIEITKSLKQYGEVIFLPPKSHDITSYSKLFKDESEKVLGIDGGLIDWKFPTKQLLRIKNLKGICTRGAWVYFLDLEYCKKNKIIVANTPGANSQSVAEYAIWQMLSLVKLLPRQIKEKFKVKYDDKHRGKEVSGKVMGIIGLGNIGSRIAKMGKGLGMEVIYWNRSKKKLPFSYKFLETVLKKADFVFNCLEGCDDTMGFLNKKRLNLMKKEAYFISVMGGAGWGVEDDKHLVNMVETGKLAGFSVENEHKGKFKTQFKGNVIIPGAYAFYTYEARDRTLKIWADSIIGIVTGKVVNRIA